MPRKETMVEFFRFTRRDRLAIITMVILIVAIYLLPNVASFSPHPPSSRDSLLIASWREFQQIQQQEMSKPGNAHYPAPANKRDRPGRAGQIMPGTLFPFDPNQLSPEGWARLGIREKTIHTILNYLSKGGRFRSPQDLEKIYGLRKDEVERLLPFVFIKEVPNEKAYAKTERAQSRLYPSKQATRVVDINSADSLDLLPLPGIGPSLAGRIINFRKRLGGFHTVTQVAETFGLADSTFQKIRPFLLLENEAVKKININLATVDELKAHPYIRYQLANPIIAYRNQHGPFKKTGDLLKIMIISDEVFQKIAPYITVD